MSTGTSRWNTIITCSSRYTSVWSACPLVERRGAIETSPIMRSHVAWSTRPVASLRGVPRTSFSNAHTACVVIKPEDAVGRAGVEAEFREPVLEL